MLVSASPVGTCPLQMTRLQGENGDGRRSLPVQGVCLSSSVQNVPACWEAVCRPRITQTGMQTQPHQEWVQNRHDRQEPKAEGEERFSLNQDQSIFSKCDLSSCLSFCHILEAPLLGLQGGEGIYLHQITFLYTSPH